MNSNGSQIDGKLSWNRELIEKFKEGFVNRITLRYAEELLKKFQEKNEIIDYISLEKIESYVRDLFFRLMASLITGLPKSELESIYPGELYNDPQNLIPVSMLNSINCLEITHDIIFEAEEKFPPFKELPPHYLGLIYEEIQELFLKVAPSKSEIEKNESQGKFRSEKQKIYLDKNRISRKRIGSFYTPHYISKYIVNHSIEPILEEKINYFLKNDNFGIDSLLNDILKEILGINILDPAMGAGFFLRDAANFILEKLIEIFDENQERIQAALKLEESEKQPEPELLKKISIRIENTNKISFEKEELLKIIYENVIFGVDLDPFAVELTKLIVWLSFHPNNQFKKEDFSFINDNFRCGNSLLTSLEDIFKIPRIKFDIIIGNPPYGALFSSEDKKKLKKLYETTSRDSSAYLLEMCIKYSRHYVGVIVPKSIAFYSSWASIRKFIITNTCIIKIADPGIAFRHVTFEELILILKTKKDDKSEIRNLPKQKFVNIDIFSDLKQATNKKGISRSGTIPFSLIKKDDELLFRPLSNFEFELLNKINKNSLKIKDLKRMVTRGLYIPDSEKKNILGESYENLYESNWEEKQKKFDFINYINKVPDVKRYKIKKIYHIPFKSLNKLKYLRKIEKIFTPKVFIKVLRGKRILSYPDTKGAIIPTEKLVCLIINEKNYSLNYICAVLNSKIASWYIQKTLFSDITETSRVMDDIYLKKIPIPKIQSHSDTQNSELFKELTGLFIKKEYEEIYQKIKNLSKNSGKILAELHEFISYLVDNLLTKKIINNSIQFKKVNDLTEKVISVLYGLDENEYNYISKYFEHAKSS